MNTIAIRCADPKSAFAAFETLKMAVVEMWIKFYSTLNADICSTLKLYTLVSKMKS